MTAISHVELERAARDLCEQSRGPGAWERKGCKRQHWRKRALPLATQVEQQTPYARVKDALANIMGGRW